MQTQNDLLKGILGVLSKIEKNTRGAGATSGTGKGGAKTGNISGSLGKMSGTSINFDYHKIAESLVSLTKSVFLGKKLKLVASGVESLFKVFQKYGSMGASMAITNSIRNLNKISIILLRLARPLAAVGTAIMMFGLGMLAFAGALYLMATLFGAGTVAEGIMVFASIFVVVGAEAINDLATGVGATSILEKCPTLQIGVRKCGELGADKIEV